MGFGHYRFENLNLFGISCFGLPIRFRLARVRAAALLGAIRAADRQKRACWLLFGLLLAASAAFYHPVEYDNTASRYFLVSAVVDYHQLSIDPYASHTQDISFHDGRHYSNKAIGAPLLGIPVYWVLRRLIGPADAQPLSRANRYWVRLAVSSLPYAITGAVLFHLACLMGAARADAWKMALAYGFGTLAWIHATLFSGHQTAASLGFISFYIVFRSGQSAARGGRPGPAWHCLAAGILAGLAGLADYTAWAMAVLLAAYGFSLPLSVKAKACFAAGVAACALVLVGYNAACFASPWSLSYAHQTVEVFRQGAARGVAGVTWPKADVLAALLFSPSRGLLFIMPFFVFVPAGLARMWQHRRWYREAAFLATVSLAYLLINSGFYGWHGGWCFGPRYLVPALPFMALPLAFALDRGFALLLSMACFQIIWAVASMPHCPPEILNPVAELVMPLAARGYWAQSVAGTGGQWVVMAVVAAAVIATAARPRWLFGSAGPAPGRPSLRHAAAGPLALAMAIGLVLALHGSPCPDQVHGYRMRLLQDGAAATGSDRLRAAAFAEQELALEAGKNGCRGRYP